MIFKQIEEIVNGIKTQTRRIVKAGEVGLYLPVNYTIMTANKSIKWQVGRDYAIVPARTLPGIKGHRIRITGIRMEYLWQINIGDAKAEGVASVDVYKELWERINGVGSWDKNPQVWVIDFECIEVQ